MPLMRLTGSYERAALVAAADAIHHAMVRCLNVPADDIFRVLDAVENGVLVADPQYLDIERQRPLFVEITLRKGRDDDAKRTFYRTVADTIGAGIRPADLLIVLHENDAVDWSFGNGVAQRAPASGVAANR